MFSNWKTTSPGLILIAGAIIHLIFAIKAGKSDETLWTTTMGAIIGGIGLIFARDATAAKVQNNDLKQILAQHESAIRTGDTSVLTKHVEPTKPAP